MAGTVGSDGDVLSLCLTASPCESLSKYPPTSLYTSALTGLTVRENLQSARYECLGMCHVVSTCGVHCLGSWSSAAADRPTPCKM